MGGGIKSSSSNGFGASMPEDDRPGGGMDLSGRTERQQHQRYHQQNGPSSTGIDGCLSFLPSPFFLSIEKRKDYFTRQLAAL